MSRQILDKADSILMFPAYCWVLIIYHFDLKQPGQKYSTCEIIHKTEIIDGNYNPDYDAQNIPK